MPENFEIANIWAFGLLPLPFLVYWLIPALRFSSSALLFPGLKNAEKVSGEKSRKAALIKKRNIVSWTGLIIIWILMIVTISSPQLVGKPEIKVKTSRNFLVVADISFSMAQKDWTIDGEKVSRWIAVKNVMHDFISKRQGDRMGLIFFGSSAYVQVPFTPDLNTVEMLLEEADVGMAGQMTNIGKAIVKGIEMFDNDSITTKVMLVLTDGVDSGTEILPLDAADLAKNDSIRIYTVGIGDPSVATSDLDEKTLEQIAEFTDAKYFRAIDSEKLQEIYSELDKLEPIEYEEENYKPRTLLYYYPLSLLIILALILSFIFSTLSAIRIFNKKNSDNV
jgi:Ca-activated chloride channel family protein